MRGLLAALLVLASPTAHARAVGQKSAEQIVRAYQVAIESKDLDLFRAVTWPDGKHCWKSTIRCQKLGDLSGNFFGGIGIFHRSRFAKWKTSHKADSFEFIVTFTTRTYYVDEFSGMSSQGEQRFVVTNRVGQWRVVEVEVLSQRDFGDDKAWHERHKK